MSSAVVLAAGLGTRLTASGGRPKWLVAVGTTCPADVQLAGLAAAGVERVVVVTGPDAGPIQAHLAAWRGDLDVVTVPNPRHRELNNWYSLLLGLRELRSAGDGGTTVVNSDLFASEAWIEQAAASSRATTGSAALVVDTVRPLTEEAMKVSADRARSAVRRIGKVGVSGAVGEYVGMAWWSAAARDALVELLAALVDDRQRTHHWYEHAIDDHLRAGGDYALVPVPSTDWVEIDDDDDLAAAERLGVSGPVTASRQGSV